MLLLALTGCFLVPDNVPPTLVLDAPRDGTWVSGYSLLEVSLFAVDDRKRAIDMDVMLDGEFVGTTRESGCDDGCWGIVTVDITDVEAGEHVVSVQAFDRGGNEATAPDAVIGIWDVPFVDAIEVTNSQEGGFNGPDLEVEVHLEDIDGVWRGCASVPEVQADDREFRGLHAPFVADESLEPIRWDDVLDLPLRMVVVESDSGLHCPIPYDIDDTFLEDDDDLYGVGPIFDAVDAAGGIEQTFDDVTGLAFERGRPRGLWSGSTRPR